MDSPTRSTASAPPRRGIPLLRRPLRRREGGESPSPACTYGRIGWGFAPAASRRRWSWRRWFWCRRAFSGGGALRSSPSPRSTWRCSTPGAALERCSFSSDPGRRIWRPDLGVLRALLLPPATDPEAAMARWRRRARGASATVVQRPRFRRGAADTQGGVFQGKNSSQAAVSRRMLLFFFVAGGSVDLGTGSGSSSSCRCSFLCLIYVLCM